MSDKHAYHAVIENAGGGGAFVRIPLLHGADKKFPRFLILEVFISPGGRGSPDPAQVLTAGLQTTSQPHKFLYQYFWYLRSPKILLRKSANPPAGSPTPCVPDSRGCS